MAEQQPQTTRRTDYGFYVAVILLAVLAWAGQSYMQWLATRQIQAQGGVAGPVLDRLNGLESKELDAFLEINRLLTTLGTALLGGIFYLLFDSGKTLMLKQRKWAAILGLLFVSTSIFFGYVAYTFVIAMLRDGGADVTVSKPHWAQQAHFYTFLLGVTFLADFLFHNLPEDRKSEVRKND